MTLALELSAAAGRLAELRCGSGRLGCLQREGWNR
jgi:hypothetical protein